jgi:thiosulfate/3-mercaptopyruvate sulfurtransferase
MSLKTRVIALLLILSACTSEKTVDQESEKSSYLIEASELILAAKRPAIKILDFRIKAEYQKGHVLGALHIWRTDIEDTTYAYKGIMASTTQIEELFSTLGIDTKDTIVVYDDNGLCDASRLWWVLQNYDFTAVKLLHGGYQAWKDMGGDISIEQPTISNGLFKLTDNPSLKYAVAKDEVRQALENSTILLDTRTEDEYSGKRQKNGAVKGGRIPASTHIDWAEAIDYAGDKRLKSVEDLERIYGRLNATKEDPILVYCHSGVRSAHTYFVLTQLLGYKNVKNYDGSWVEWSHFDSLPFEQDSITTLK